MQKTFILSLMNQKKAATGNLMPVAASAFIMVGLTRFELVTSSMSTRHSNQLSYNPNVLTTRFIIAARCAFVNNFFENPRETFLNACAGDGGAGSRGSGRCGSRR